MRIAQGVRSRPSRGRADRLGLDQEDPQKGLMRKRTGWRVDEILAKNRIPHTLLWATVVAFAVRLVVVGFVYQSFLDPTRGHWEFAYEAGNIARSIVTGHGFANPYWVDTGPTAEVAPVLPYLFAGVMALFGIYTKA